VRLATSRYANHGVIRESGMTPVGITLGEPKFPLHYELAGNLRLLAPTRDSFGCEDFADRYLARLDAKGLERIEGVLRRYVHGYRARPGGHGVVLLCFECVQAGEFCHRRLFADWWQAATGDEVHELLDRAPVPKRLARPTPTQLALFGGNAR